MSRLYVAACRHDSEVGRLVFIAADKIETARELFLRYVEHIPNLDVAFYEVPEALATILGPTRGWIQDFWLDVDNDLNQSPMAYLG